MNIKKILLPVLLVAVFGIYIVYEKFYGNQSNASPIGNDKQSLDQNPPIQNGGNQAQNASTYQDGEYTGDFADAFYGPVQIKAVISQGKIIDVQFLKYPDHQGHTLELSNQTRPILKQEALQAQSANVDIVSGATQTSQAFIKSLASALTKAGSTNQIKIEVTPPPKAI